MTVNQRIIERNVHLLDNFHIYLAKNQLLANKTMRAYLDSLKLLRVFIGEYDKSLDQFTTEDLGKFLTNSITNKALKTIHLEIASIKRFYDYLVEYNVIEKSPLPKVDTRNKLKQEGKYYAAVLTAQQIFSVRRRTLDLRVAAIFELLLSTGMRQGEARQIRACDIRWDMIPVDTQTGKPSQYVSATICLRKKYHSIKRREERDVYLNNIAGKLVKKYMEVIGIKNKVPLFPFDVKYMQQYVSYACSGIYDPENHPCIKKDHRGTKHAGVGSESYDDVLDEDLIGLPPDFLRIMNISKDAIKKFAMKYKAENVLCGDSRVAVKMHPHGLRHTFSNIQYYRSFSGRTQDAKEIKILMGHAAVETTQIYLDLYHAINTEQEWIRLHNGTRMDHIYAMNQDYVDFTSVYGETFNPRWKRMH